MGYQYLLSTKTYYSQYQRTKVVWPSGRPVGGPATPKQRECHRYKFGSQGEGTASPLLHTRSLRVRSRLHFSPESSLSRVFRGSSETEDRARLRFHRTLTDSPGRCHKHLALLTAEHRQDWSRALGDVVARPPRSLLSTPLKGPVCVGSTQPQLPQGEQKGPRVVPTKTQPGMRTIAELGETSVRTGAATPFRAPVGPEPQAAKTRARVPRCRPGAQASATLFREFGTSPLQGRGPGSRDGRRELSAVRRRRHKATPSRDGKTGQCGPRTLLGARSLSVAGYSPSGTRGQRKLPDRSPAPRDMARLHHASLSAQVKREQDAPGNEPSKQGLRRVGQAPEPRASVPRRGNERPKR